MLNAAAPFFQVPSSFDMTAADVDADLGQLVGEAYCGTSP
jgi:hypothetical protein